MSEYLLAAEADKIQDLIFRSSHLREVVGGSQMLTHFCQETAPNLAKDYAGKKIISDGGSFLFRFDDNKKAASFGPALAEAYRRELGGTLTVIEKPVSVNGDFTTAQEETHRALRAAKEHQAHYLVTPHFPYIAFCASCGTGLAVTHDKLRKKDPEGQYLCPQCKEKSLYREKHGQEYFLQLFYGKLNRPVPDDILVAEEIGKLDPRNYVAYLLADGNNMGKVFGKCASPEQMETLSKKLADKTREGLAGPTEMMLVKQKAVLQEKIGDRVPILPLILGGDDLFVLIPAPWALDFAYRFAQTYEHEIGEIVRDFSVVPKPTVSVAVVICKAKYPYYLAHQRGEELLAEAKKFSKRWAVDNNNDNPSSVINFDVILGSRLAGEEHREGKHRRTLKPYWVDDSKREGWGISIKHMIDQRYELCKLPHKRLEQLEAHFDTLAPVTNSDERKKWLDRLEKLLKRILSVAGSSANDLVSKALEALGGKELFEVSRTTDKEDWFGHALPDLLSAWDFAFSLDKSREEYEE